MIRYRDTRAGNKTEVRDPAVAPAVLARRRPGRVALTALRPADSEILFRLALVPVLPASDSDAKTVKPQGWHLRLVTAAG